MQEPLLQRIDELERANRRWKMIALVLGIALAVVFATGGTFVAVLGSRVAFDNGRAVRALEEARMQEALAREQAVAAQMLAEQRLQEARKRAAEEQ